MPGVYTGFLLERLLKMKQKTYSSVKDIHFKPVVLFSSSSSCFFKRNTQSKIKLWENAPIVDCFNAAMSPRQSKKMINLVPLELFDF